MHTTSTPGTITRQLQAITQNEITLGLLTREAHWNVTGPGFYQHHELFGAHYKTIDGYVDEIAERIRQLGPLAAGQPANTERDLQSSITGLMSGLVAQHKKTTELLKEGIRMAAAEGDEGTADLLTGILQGHDKMLWMLNASVN